MGCRVHFWSDIIHIIEATRHPKKTKQLEASLGYCPNTSFSVGFSLWNNISTHLLSKDWSRIIYLLYQYSMTSIFHDVQRITRQKTTLINYKSNDVILVTLCIFMHCQQARDNLFLYSNHLHSFKNKLCTTLICFLIVQSQVFFFFEQQS